jgi:hypothetical protein
VHAARCAASERVCHSRWRDASTALALRLLCARADAAARSRLPHHQPDHHYRAMADADPAPAALPEANPDLASDAELTERAAALVAALRSGDSDAQTEAAQEIELLVAAVDAYSEPPQPANPRTVAALVAAGVGAALVPLIHRASELTGAAAAHALRSLMMVCDTERRAVFDNLGINKLLQMLHESTNKLQRNALAPILYELTFCNEFMESLSSDSDLVSRIFSLPFLSTATPSATERAVAVVERLIDLRPSFGRAWLPACTAVLSELLSFSLLSQPKVGRDDAIAAWIDLSETVCILLHTLQKQEDFDIVAFDEARVHVACVELLGQLLANGVSVGRSYAASARVLFTSFEKSPMFRQRIHNLIFACPGALSGVIAGVGHACSNHDDGDALVGFLDGLRGVTPASAESFLVDTHFAAFAVFYRSVIQASRRAYVHMRGRLISVWKSPGCLRALAQPLTRQKLAAAVSLACLSDEGHDFRRILAENDHLEVLAQALVVSASSPRLDTGTDLAGDFQAWRETALRRSLQWLASEVGLDDTGVAGVEAAAGPAAKRARTAGGALVRASDVNVQRRDSTVLLIAGRPFYVVGLLIETKSAVLADALSGATTLDPIAIALSNEVPEDQQYDLFHAAVEHAYTGSVASDLAAESLLPLWCLGDHLQMDELCAWCAERLVPVLAKDAALLERAWSTALARPSDTLGDACATAWLALEYVTPGMEDISAMLLLKRVHESCAAKELVAAQLVRVLRKALLADIAKDDAAAADEEDD